MSSLFFFYSLAILIVCTVSIVLSAAAWASSRQRIFLFGSSVFFCYGIETTAIFLNEYLMQNALFPAAQYYNIGFALGRAVLATVLQGSIWLIALEALDRHSKRLFWIPVILFFIASASAAMLMPVGPLRQWVYYSVRQFSLLFIMGYCAWSYRTSKNEVYRARLKHFTRPFAISAVLVLCILVEDSLNILVTPIDNQPSWLALYLSERNFSESILMCYCAFLLIRYAFHVLSIRMKEAPAVNEVNDLERHVDELMPHFRERFHLSERESEVLRLVLLGNSNQEIAGELYLALGTVKTHVHNILKKTSQPSREALALFFWQN